VSPQVWDGADNMVFRPLAESFAVEASLEAVNVDSLDEVPHRLSPNWRRGLGHWVWCAPHSSRGAGGGGVSIARAQSGPGI